MTDTNMNETKEELAERFFAGTVTARERACFEAGIKLGALFHSVLGFPFKNEPGSLAAIQDGFIASFKTQPYVKTVDIKIIPPEPGTLTKSHEFDYGVVQGHMIDVNLQLHYNGVDLVAKIKWVPELHYPLMFIKEIS
ncbi:MAG: dihydroneopterin aldolase family protein [Promethearchaeota archaeon]